MREPVSRAGGWSLIGLSVLVSVFTVVAFGAFSDRPIWPADNHHYFFIAERVAAGVPPHVSAFDPKSTLSLLITGFGIAAGDLAGVAPLISARVVSILTLIVAVGGLGLFVYRLTSRLAVGVLAVLAASSFSYVTLMAAVGSRPKLFLMAFMVSSLLALQSRRVGMSAALASLAFLTWQPGILMLGALFLTLAVTRSTAAEWSRAATGAALPVVLYAGYFFATGAGAELIEQEYVFPSTYMTHASVSLSQSLTGLENLWRRGYGVHNLLPFVFAAGLVWGAVRAARSPRASWAWLRERPAAILFILTTLAAGAFTVYDHQGPPDYFFVLPFVAGISALVLGELARVAERVGGRWSSGALLGLSALALVAVIAINIRDQPIERFTLADQMVVADEVGEWLAEGETVYAIGTSYLLALNRAENWSRWSSFFRGLNPYLEEQRGREVFDPTRDGRLPTLVLLARRPPPGWPEWLEARYDEITQERHTRLRMQVFRLRGPAR